MPRGNRVRTDLHPGHSGGMGHLKIIPLACQKLKNFVKPPLRLFSEITGVQHPHDHTQLYEIDFNNTPVIYYAFPTFQVLSGGIRKIHNKLRWSPLGTLALWTRRDSRAGLAVGEDSKRSLVRFLGITSGVVTLPMLTIGATSAPSPSPYRGRP